MRAIPVGRTDSGMLYYVIEGEQNGALINKKKQVFEFDFLSFLAKRDVDRIMSSDFHDFLWGGVDLPDNRWRNIVQYGVQKVPEQMLAGVDVLTEFPNKKKERSGAMREKDDRAMEFKSLIAAEQHEKALARALARGARRATGGTRGFIRGAVFNPDAEDADGDGWVQEGTQFARRATGQAKRRARRVVRAQERLENSETVGMRSFRSGMGASQMRWVSRSKEHYTKRHGDVLKQVQDKYNNGNPIKKYGDIRKALIRAHPGFANGDSKIDFLAGADDDSDAQPGHIAHVVGFLYGLMANPELENVNFVIEQNTNPRIDGSAAWLGRHRVNIDASGTIIMAAGPDKKPTIALKYNTETHYHTTENLRELGNFQLEAHKAFVTLLRDVPPRSLPDPTTGNMVPNPNLTDEERAAWEFAAEVASSMVTIHEMGHAAHKWVSMRDAMAADGLGPTDTLSVDLVRQRLRNYVARMSKEDKRDSVRSLALTEERDLVGLGILLVGGISDPDKRRKAMFGDLKSLDGSGKTITVNQELADWLNAIGKDMFPNPTKSRWKDGDPLPFVIASGIFDLAPAGRRPLFADRTMPYYMFKPWNLRTLATRVEFVNGQKVPVPNLELLIENGLPRTPMSQGLSPETGQIIAEALIRGARNAVSAHSNTIVIDPDSVVTTNVPIPNAPNMNDVIDGKVGESVMDEVLEFFLNESMDRIISSQNPRAIRTGLEHLFMGTKYFDDLTAEEKRIAREIAMLGSGGEWAAYMAAFTQHFDLDHMFRFWDFELIAELIAANSYGNEIRLFDGESVRQLTEKEAAVLAKIASWIFPEDDFRLK